MWGAVGERAATATVPLQMRQELAHLRAAQESQQRYAGIVEQRAFVGGTKFRLILRMAVIIPDHHGDGQDLAVGI